VVRACAIALLWELAQSATAQQAPNAPAAAAQAQTDEELAERALDRTLVATGIVLLPSGILEVEPEVLYTRDEQSSPGVFTNTNGAVFLSEQRLNENLLNAAVQMRLGLPADTQVELYLPYTYVSQQQVTEVGLVPRGEASTSLSGLGDVNVALAKTLLVERTGQPNLVARLSWNADTGPTDRTLGLSTGTGFNEARFSLLATKRQDPLVFLGGPYYDRSFEEAGERQGDKIGVTVGAALAASPETSLRVVLNQEFDGNREVQGLVQHGSNQTIGILTFGASMTFGAGKFLDLTVQDGLTRDAPKMAIGIALSMRFDTPLRR
jgi:Putative MetA-pathway of phenol degradation